VYPPSHELQTHRVLDKLAGTSSSSQRSLARELGIALGLTNALLRELVGKGCIEVQRRRPNQLCYVLTSKGAAEKARLARLDFLRRMELYTQIRDRVKERLAQIVDTPQCRLCPIVFYGGGDLAEIAWLCVQKGSVRVVGVVDDNRVGSNFFGVPVVRTLTLRGNRCNGVPYDWLVVATATNERSVRKRLRGAGVDATRTIWLS
jgi:DNA-binding MarR family transcriptional regulator